MLIKEYRIPLPLSVEEYRVAQLYMIAVSIIIRCFGRVFMICFLFQKKSSEETQGAGSGVEILINEPYDDGPGGVGQYTHKIYHVGHHLPGNSMCSYACCYDSLVSCVCYCYDSLIYSDF